MTIILINNKGVVYYYYYYYYSFNYFIDLDYVKISNIKFPSSIYFY